MDRAMRRTALVDSSSAIILFKACLFEYTAEYFRIVIPASVFEELTVGGRSGSEEFARYRADGSIQVRDTDPLLTVEGDMGGLDTGERDTILLYEAGSGEVILLDDGKGAAICRRRRIPHINALLVPRIFRRAGTINVEECERQMATIMIHGRYSDWVVDYARSCPDDDLADFA
ncbi:MAG: hypothetical protein E4G96_04630 [Chrysiogenales bacterium]|nr:MAG: hypothetical protein E4G96_04630 [Chrysiogenales bacterium]